MDSSRLRTGELVAGIGGVALFVFLFFDWFGADFQGFDASVSGWDGLGGDVTGFVVALSSVAAVALAGLALSGQRVNIPVPRGSVTAGLGSLSVLIILWRFFANPGDLKVGIFLGLAAAVAIAVGALMALMEDGFRPLVAVPGGRTRAAAASPPAATPSPPPTAETAEVPAAGTSRSSGGSAPRKSPARSGGSRGGSRSKSKTGSKPRSKSGSKSSSAGKRSSSTRSRSKTTRKRSSGGRK